MKKTIFLLFTLMPALNLAAQNSSSRPSPSSFPAYSFFWSPVSLVAGTMDVGGEVGVADRISLMAQGHIGFKNIQLWEALEGRYRNFGGQIQFRNYIGKNSGFYGGPYWNAFLKGHSVSVFGTLQEKEYEMVHSRGLTPGLGMGWKFILSRKIPNITLDVSLGAGYRLGNVSGRYAAQSRSIIFKDQGIVPVAGFRIAYTPPSGYRQSYVKPGEKKVGKKEDFSTAIAYYNRYGLEKKKAIEEALKAKGFNPGKRDGIIDARTIKAVLSFQKKFGLKEDGKVGEASMKKLQIK